MNCLYLKKQGSNLSFPPHTNSSGKKISWAEEPQTGTAPGTMDYSNAEVLTQTLKGLSGRLPLTQSMSHCQWVSQKISPFLLRHLREILYKLKYVFLEGTISSTHLIIHEVFKLHSLKGFHQNTFFNQMAMKSQRTPNCFTWVAHHEQLELKWDQRR